MPICYICLRTWASHFKSLWTTRQDFMEGGSGPLSRAALYFIQSRQVPSRNHIKAKHTKIRCRPVIYNWVYPCARSWARPMVSGRCTSSTWSAARGKSLNRSPLPIFSEQSEKDGRRPCFTTNTQHRSVEQYPSTLFIFVNHYHFRWGLFKYGRQWRASQPTNTIDRSSNVYEYYRFLNGIYRLRYELPKYNARWTG